MKIKKMIVTVGIASLMFLLSGIGTHVSAETKIPVIGGRGDIFKILWEELCGLAYNRTYNDFEANAIQKYEVLPSGGGRWDSLIPWNIGVEPFANVNNDLRLKQGETLAAHHAMLANNTNADQTLKTVEFTYTNTDTVTTSTTHATGLSMTTSAKMTLPFAEGSLSMTAKYDFSTTKAVQSSEVRQWKVPAQDIKIPAGRKYRVNWFLNTGIATGTVDLTSHVTAMIPYKINPNTGVRYAQNLAASIAAHDSYVNKNPKTPYIWGAKEDWKIIDDGKVALRKWGTSKYTAKYGTELVMSVTDVTDTKTRALPVEIERRTLHITPESVG